MKRLWRESVKKLSKKELKILIEEIPNYYPESVYMFLYQELEKKTSKEYVRKFVLAKVKRSQNLI